MPNLILIGFMGTGKTTVGRKAAQRLGMKFVDTDQEIEKVTGMSVKALFKKHGEIRFRSEEKAAVYRIIRQDNQVIATGGGLVVDPENLEKLKQNGFLISLTAEPEVIYERVKSKKTRPLLQTESPLDTIKTLLQQREAIYMSADQVIDTSSLALEEVVEKVLASFREYCAKGVK